MTIYIKNKFSFVVADGLAVYNRSHFLDGNLPDTEDIVSYENNDGEAEAMIEESPSGKYFFSWLRMLSNVLAIIFHLCDMSSAIFFPCENIL